MSIKDNDKFYYSQKIKQIINKCTPVIEKNKLPAPKPNEILGCGNNGCVFETADPDIVMKFTRERDEAVFLNFQKHAGISGIINVKFVINIINYGFLIWRDRLDLCCDKAIKTLLKEHGFSKQNYDPKRGWYSCEYGRVFKIYENLVAYGEITPENTTYCDEIASIPGLRDIGNGLGALADNGLFLTDIHEKNVGRYKNYDQLIIFDALPIGDESFWRSYKIEKI